MTWDALLWVHATAQALRMGGSSAGKINTEVNQLFQPVKGTCYKDTT